MKEKKDPSGLFFVGSIILGTGVGMLAGDVSAGAVLGVGVGFIVMGIFRLRRTK